MTKFAGAFAGCLVGGTIGFLLMILVNQFLPLSPEKALLSVASLSIVFAVIGGLKPKRFSWVVHFIPFP